jgi:hypothetical protein
MSDSAKGIVKMANTYFKETDKYVLLVSENNIKLTAL